MFDINTTLFELLGYRMSSVLLAAITGLLATWFAARANIVTWIFAIINAVLFFRLYYQVNLYSAMSLQLFFGNAIYGWFNWRRQTSDTDEPVTLLSHRERISWAAVLIISRSGSRYHYGTHPHLAPGPLPREGNFYLHRCHDCCDEYWCLTALRPAETSRPVSSGYCSTS